MSSPVDARRRWFGVFFLIVAGGLLIWGQTWLKPHLRGFVFVTYWLACMGFLALAIFTALLDAWATRRRLRDQQRELLRRTMEEIASDKDGPKRSSG